MKTLNSFKKTKVKIIFAGLLVAMVAGVAVVGWIVYKGNNNPEVAQVEPSKATKNVKLDSQKVAVTDSKPEKAPVEAKKDPNQKQEFGEKNFGFSFSYPGSWSSQPCSTATTNYSFYSVLLSPENNSLPACGWLKVPENAQIILSTLYSASYYSKDHPNYYDEVKQNTGYYTSHTWKNVEVNGRQMLRVETTWSGAGGVIPEGAKTVEYHYLDSAKDRLFKATYWLRGTDKDHLSEFENLIKTLTLDL